MFDAQTKRFCSAVTDALPDTPEELMQSWINNPKALNKVLVEALIPPHLQLTYYVVEKVLSLGTWLKTYRDFQIEFDAKGISVSNAAKELMAHTDFNVSPNKTEIEVVFISGMKLGFKQSATRREIISKALKKGYELCPPEVGPQLRLQYNDQPVGDLIIAMEPIKCSDGRGYVFSVDHPDGTEYKMKNLQLGVDAGNDDHTWNNDKRWVFVRSRK